MNMNKSWDGKTPDWELEPTGAEQKENIEAGAEKEPSVAEKRLEELAAERKEVPTENPEQKATQVEALRAEVADMAKLEQKPTDDPSHRHNSVTGSNTPAQSEKLNALHQEKRERNQSVNTFLAEERNKDRTLWQKISGKGKLSAEDIAHEQALKINAEVDSMQELKKQEEELFVNPRTNTEFSVEATREVNDGIIEELEKLGVNLEALKENGFKFDQEVLTKEKEPALGALREKMGSAVANIFDKLAKVDKEKVMMVSVVAGLIAAMVPVLGLHDLQSVISMLPDSVAQFLQSPELAGSPAWAIVTPGGESFSMPSVENYMHQVDVFNNIQDVTHVAEGINESNPFGSAVDMSDPSTIAKLKHLGEIRQDLHRMGSGFANLAFVPVIVGTSMYAGKIFGKIGKHFMGEKK